MEPDKLFHEKQWLGHCAIHTLNNLLQEKWMSYEEMTKISEKLHQADRISGLTEGFFNPYQSFLPYAGYFDIGCIRMALEDKSLFLSEHIALTDHIDQFDWTKPTIIGIIINEEIISVFWRSCHWIALLKAESGYFNMDSKLPEPIRIAETHEELKSYLKSKVSTQKCRFFVVERRIS
jgi:hypothetical protein